MNDLNQSIEQFLSAQRFAVAGASEDPEKYGHQCFVALHTRGFTVFPLNPNAKNVLGITAYPNLAALPEPVESLSIVTPPSVTEHLIGEAISAGVKNIWMQPGAEPHDETSLNRAHAAGINLISGGPCLLVELRGRRHGVK